MIGLLNLIMTALLILQWNAQGMNGHSGELINYLNSQEKVVHLICIQETWYEGNTIIDIPNYSCFSKNRINKRRGGCAIYIHTCINYEYVEIETDIEMQLVNIHYGDTHLAVVNYYNPCNDITNDILDTLVKHVKNIEKLLIVGDFNSHNSLWGSEKNDKNGRLIEDFLLKQNLVILNDGSGTRLDPISGRTSCLDLSLISSGIASKCTWSVFADKFGSDHFPVYIEFYIQGHCNKTKHENEGEQTKWSFKKMDWTAFSRMCEEKITIEALYDEDVNIFHANLIETLYDIFRILLPSKNNKKTGNPVPWWTETCSAKIKER